MPITRKAFIESDEKTQDKIIRILKADPNNAYSAFDFAKKIYLEMATDKNIDPVTSIPKAAYLISVLTRMTFDKVLVERNIDGTMFYVLAEERRE